MASYRIALPWDRIPPALQSVIACLRFSFDRDPDKLLETCRRIDDWQAFLWWTRRHRVLPLVYKNLHRCAWDILPDAVRTTLEKGYRRNGMQSLALAGETVRLIRLLAQKGIKAIPLKGSVLALQVYGSLDSRHAGDIDLLIAPENIDRADEIIRRQGYCLDNPDITRTPLRRRVVVQKVHHHHYFSSTKQIIAELHWRLNPIFRLPLHFDQLWSQGEQVSLTRDVLTVISSELNMIFLCIHGATHGWGRLKWLSDIAHIQAGYRQSDWKRLFEVGHELNALRPVLQATVLSHILLGSPLPDFVMSKASEDRMMASLLSTAVCRLSDRSPDPLTVSAKCAFHLYRASLRNSLRHKIDNLNLSINSDDWRTVPLPDALFFLYYLIRPLLWVTRQVQRKMTG